MARVEALAISPAEEKNSTAPHILNGFRTAIEAKKAERERELKQQEWSRQHSIFVAATSIGADYFEATGKMPDESVLDNLFSNDYTSYDSKDILESGVFYDWNDYLSFVEQKQKDRLSEDEMGKKQILSEIAKMIDSGELPFIFVADIEPYKSEEKLAKIENDGQRSLNDTKRLTGVLADSDELTRRFAKYQIASELVIEKEDEKGSHSRRLQNINTRRLNIALGVNIDTGKILNHAFVQEIKGSNNLLSIDDIKNSDIYQKWYDVLHLKERQQYLDELGLAAAPLEEPEYYYEFESQKLLLLGRVAISSFSESDGKKHLEQLAQKQKLLVGKQAAAVFNRAKKNHTLHELGYLLRSDIELPNLGRRSINNDLPRHELVDYARWLISIASKVPKTNKEADLNEKVIRRAFQLGIGPSYQEAARRTFSSLTKLYDELNHENLHQIGKFDSWTRNDFAKYLREAKLLAGRIPTIRDLIKLAHEDRNRPSPFRIIAEFDGSMSLALKEAGFENYGNGAALIQQYRETDKEKYIKTAA